MDAGRLGDDLRVPEEGAPAPTPHRRPSLWLLLLALPVACIFGAEAVGRAYIATVYGVPDKSYGIYRSDPVLGATHAENSYNRTREFNEHGFQTAEPVIHDPPQGAPRVIVYGDTTAFSPNLEMAKTWPHRLQAKLRAQVHAQAQVLNAGEDGWSMGHALLRANSEMEALSPEAVILYGGAEEELNKALLAAEGLHLEAAIAAGSHGHVHRSGKKGNWLYRNSVAFKALVATALPWLDGLVRPAEAAGPVDHPAALENLRRVLRELVTLNARTGARTIYVIQAHDPDLHGAQRLAAYSRAAAGAAAEAGASVLDAQDLVAAHPGDPSELFAPSGLHLSELGADLLAERLAQAVAVQTAR